MSGKGQQRGIKSFQSAMQLKEDSEATGEFTAVFSTLNVIDEDMDVTIPGAFTDGQPVRIAYWGHRWHDLPVGKGVIHSDGERAWVDGRFFLDTQSGRETYQTVKNLGELQEWSYGFDILKQAYGEFEGRDVRFLEALDVHEVSPVMLGAGIGTHTTAIKGGRQETGEAQDDAGQDEGQGGGNSAEPGGPSPQVVLTLIEINELEV